jgi:hypothetical protein
MASLAEAPDPKHPDPAQHEQPCLAAEQVGAELRAVAAELYDREGKLKHDVEQLRRQVEMLRLQVRQMEEALFVMKMTEDARELWREHDHRTRRRERHREHRRPWYCRLWRRLVGRPVYTGFNLSSGEGEDRP